MTHCKTETESDLLEMEDIHDILGSAAELLGSVFETLAEPEAGVSEHKDFSVVPSDSLVQLELTMAAPDESHQFMDLQPMNCDLEAFFSGQVSKGIVSVNYNIILCQIDGVYAGGVG